MTLERDDENGLEFPWLLLAIPGAVALRQAAVAVQAAPMPPLVQPPIGTTVPGFEPPAPQLPAVLRPLPTTGPVSEQMFAPAPQERPAATSRVEAAVREVAAAAVARSVAKQASARFEVQTRDLEQKTPAAAQASIQSAARQLQSEVAKAPAARQVAQVERDVRAEVRKLEKAGIPPAEIERRARKKATEMRRDAGRKVQEVVAPVQRAVERLPAPVRRAGAAALAPVKREAEKAVKQATAPIRREATKAAETLLAPIRQEATRAAQQLGVGQATQLWNDQIKKMGLPNIPVVLPTDLSPTGVLNAAYNSGKKFAQDRFVQATGVPLPLPNAVSIKAIKKWADDLVPDDARQALEMGVDFGLSAASSAVSSILTGAIGGSVVPGLGTVIGIGVALGVAALKGLVKDAITEKHAFQQVCKSDDPVAKLHKKLASDFLKKGASGRKAAIASFEREMAALAPKLSPLEAIPWVAQKSFDTSKALAEEQRKTKCGMTPFRTGLRTQGKYYFEVAKVTAPVLGLQQIDKLIPLYVNAPKKEFFWDKGSVRPGGAIVGGTGKVLLGPSAAGDDVSAILKLMQVRRAQLQAFIDKASRVENLTPNEIAPLRFSLVTEIRNAAMMYQFDPSPQTEAWLKMLMGFLARLVRTEAAVVGAMKSRYEQDIKREAELKRQGKQTTWKVD